MFCNVAETAVETPTLGFPSWLRWACGSLSEAVPTCLAVSMLAVTRRVGLLTQNVLSVTVLFRSSTRSLFFGRSTGFGVANNSGDASRSMSCVDSFGVLKTEDDDRLSPAPADGFGVRKSAEGAGLSWIRRRASPAAVSLGLPSAASSASSFLRRLLISLFYSQPNTKCCDSFNFHRFFVVT